MREGGVAGDSMVFGLSNWRLGLATYSDGKD